jgi:hypothetical protein
MEAKKATKGAKKASPAGKSGKTKKPYRLVKKRSGRYAVIKQGKHVNGPDKVAILVAEGLIKVLKSKAKPEAAAE